MTTRLNPYLTFDGDARQAMEFYQSVFGGQLRISTFGEFGTSDPAVADKVMHALLNTDRGYTLMAADTAPGMPYQPGSTMTCSLSGDPEEGLAEAWERLSDGGTVRVPFEKQMWGDLYGMCVDRFGVPWMVNVVQSQ
ncbi:VOC family protein [Verrucosispora sp. WMMA2044]|uniref:VOC family protein n=1 Tax=Verrucosispora sioxanthis TaxID=2499994 RepID=A0A6M1LB72_9ACTN|nr:MULTISPECIES: VOC family protein [Micromonospora]NEE66327.1 VOC family protein [Verrucosispora sioxanthis]NGM15437.1 VOC family protein [Verrucosispora sioxanthis]WBB49812.1 VOC family protein [Verrucosispora sp. WMMA2044]